MKKIIRSMRWVCSALLAALIPVNLPSKTLADYWIEEETARGYATMASRAINSAGGLAMSYAELSRQLESARQEFWRADLTEPERAAAGKNLTYLLWVSDMRELLNRFAMGEKMAVAAQELARRSGVAPQLGVPEVVEPKFKAWSRAMSFHLGAKNPASQHLFIEEPNLLRSREQLEKALANSSKEYADYAKARNQLEYFRAGKDPTAGRGQASSIIIFEFARPLLPALTPPRGSAFTHPVPRRALSCDQSRQLPPRRF